MSLLRSFGFAFAGLWHSINYERNMRIHLVATAYVLVFSLFFPLSAAEYAILFVLIGLVLALELLNTALEAAADVITKERNPYIKIMKDAAAGAVLIAAMASVAVAAVIFWKPEGFVNLYSFFIGQPLWFLLLGVGTVLSLLFIYRSPMQIAAHFKNK